MPKILVLLLELGNHLKGDIRKEGTTLWAEKIALFRRVKALPIALVRVMRWRLELTLALGMHWCLCLTLAWGMRRRLELTLAWGSERCLDLEIIRLCIQAGCQR